MAQDGHQNATTVHLKNLLGMLVHVYYLRVDADVLDVSNHSGRRLIVPYASFTQALSRLILTPAEVALIVCHLARNVHLAHLASLRAAAPFELPPVDVPGTGDFGAFLWEIRRWPDVLEAVWNRFFQPQSEPLEDGADVINNRPFSQGRRVEADGGYKWCLGWRRGAVIAKIDVDPLPLIDCVQTHIETIIAPDHRSSRSSSVGNSAPGSSTFV